jgi:hypothetical protein
MDFSGRIRGVVEKHGVHMSRHEQMALLMGAARRAGTSGPVDLLWRCWWGIFSGGVEEAGGFAELWDRAFAGQGKEGYLHRLDSETSLDAFTIDEFRAVHAAYNVALAMGRPEMMERVGRAVRWHVENTQLDHTTSEPWALAAFAGLDETGAFAELQLHAAEAMLARVGAERGTVTLALLADALATMEKRS